MKILFGSIVTDARGRLNGHVFKKTAFGNSITKLALPRSRYAWQTNKAVARNTWFLRQWSTLSQVEKEKANLFASQNPLPNAFGVLRNIGGRNMFTKLSQQRNYPALNIVPPSAFTNKSVATELHAVNIDISTLRVNFIVDNYVDSCHLNIYVQKVTSNYSVSKSANWLRMDNLHIRNSNPISTTDNLQNVKFSLVVGDLVAVRLRLVSPSGWGELETINVVKVE